MKRLAAALMFCVVPAQAWAQIVVDGARDIAYGAPLAVQTVETEFGDGTPHGGSEIDAGYAAIEGDRLFVLLTGNLEGNFNNLEVFIDSRPGGESVLSGTPIYGGGTSAKFAGMTFDAAFTADFHLFARSGGEGTPFLLDVYDRQSGGNVSVPGSAGSTPNLAGLQGTGTIAAGNVAPGASGPALTQGLSFAFDGNNVAGVIGGIAAANGAAAAAVATGFELSIALADLGNPAPGSAIRIFAAVNGSNHDYLSNQILGGLTPPRGNLGGDGNGGFNGTVGQLDFSSYAGEQYFTLLLPYVAPPAVAIPTLGGWGLAALVLLLSGLALRRLAPRVR
jgi:hypothetical protein